VDDVVNGGLVLVLAAAATTVSMDTEPSYAMTLQLTVPFTIGLSPNQLTVTGDLVVRLVRDALTTTLTVASGAADNLAISLSQNGRTFVEAPRGVQLERKLDYSSARYELRLALTHQSQALGGMLTLSTPAFVSGVFSYYPIMGEFRVAGATPNIARLITGTSPNVGVGGSQSIVSLSADNFQTSSGTQGVAWASFIGGFFWWEPISYPAVFANGYPPNQQTNSSPPRTLLFKRPENGGTWPRALPMYIQYASPVSTVPTPYVNLFDVSTRIGASLTPSIQGARVVVTPPQPLVAGTTYDLTVSVGGSTEMTQFTAR
jgi:hypothetical protein